MAGLSGIQGSVEPVQVSAPTGEAVSEAPPVCGSAFEAAVRDQVDDVFSSDLGEPFLSALVFSEGDIVHPEGAGALMPKLQAASRGGHVRPGAEDEFELLPLRARRERVAQPGVLPGTRVTQCYFDGTALESLRFGPKRQAIPLS